MLGGGTVCLFAIDASANGRKNKQNISLCTSYLDTRPVHFIFDRTGGNALDVVSESGLRGFCLINLSLVK